MITIEKAIENTEAHVKGGFCGSIEELYESIQLGAEAMKKLELDRQTSIHYFEPLLPGEIKEPTILYSP